MKLDGENVALFQAIILFVLCMCITFIASCGPIVAGRHIGNIDGVLAVYHDDSNEVTCWLSDKGVFCIPDTQLKKEKEKK